MFFFSTKTCENKQVNPFSGNGYNYNGNNFSANNGPRRPFRNFPSNTRKIRFGTNINRRGNSQQYDARARNNAYLRNKENINNSQQTASINFNDTPDENKKQDKGDALQNWGELCEQLVNIGNTLYNQTK